MTAEYTKDHEKIVLKVLSYQPHQFYEILAVEKTANEAEIKKSYRKLAVRLHPDKNPHPRSAEAFKYLNKAWGVLSDPSKKRIYDQTGSDPDSRFMGHSGNGDGEATHAFARGSGFERFGGFQRGGNFEDDIFNMFFGGGQGFGAGPTFTFGNNGFTFQSFGGEQQPFFANTNRARRQRQTRQRQQQQPPQADSALNILKQLLPILLFLIVPIISAFFNDSDSPEFSFYKTRQFNVERHTPKHKIPFYIAPDFMEKKKLSDRQLKSFELKVENQFVRDKRSKCSREQLLKNEMMEDAQGWFYTDYNKLQEAESLRMPNCETLRTLNLI